MEEDVKKTRLRSPAYPAISLGAAIERVKALYDEDKTAVIPTSAAAKHIGFATAHGQAMMCLSALRKFGLVEYPGNGRVMVTRRAVEILTFPEGHERKIKALQEAALSPAIYLELFEKYQYSGLPSNEAISAELIADRGFNPSAVDSFLSDFRDSLEYARLLKDGMLSSAESASDKRGADPQSIGPWPEKKNLAGHSDDENRSTVQSTHAQVADIERIVFSHEIEPKHAVRIIAVGEVDESLLDALQLFVELQRRRLERSRVRIEEAASKREGKDTAA
jgi:hypothetical protein